MNYNFEENKVIFSTDKNSKPQTQIQPQANFMTQKPEFDVIILGTN